MGTAPAARTGCCSPFLAASPWARICASTAPLETRRRVTRPHPWQYTLLPWAIVLGWLFFADLPNTLMLVGGAIIIGAGLLLLVRESACGPGQLRPAHATTGDRR